MKLEVARIVAHIRYITNYYESRGRVLDEAKNKHDIA